MPSTSHSARLGRLAFKLASALVGGTAAASVAAAAQSVTPEQAPAEWLRYAQSATVAVQRLLEAETETAIRLRAYLDATRPAPDQPTTPLVIKLWVDAEGVISRIDHTPFAHAEANADLRALVAGQRLPGMPPKGMLLPMRVAIQLDPVPTVTPVSQQSAPARDPRKLI